MNAKEVCTWNKTGVYERGKQDCTNNEGSKKAAVQKKKKHHQQRVRGGNFSR